MKVKQSEQNLAAQHQVLMQQQICCALKHQIEYANYGSQHQAFVKHATQQIQQLEQQKQQIEQQIAAATVQVVSPTTIPPFAPSGAVVNVPNFYVAMDPTPSFDTIAGWVWVHIL
jgi:hypothetical protein